MDQFTKEQSIYYCALLALFIFMYTWSDCISKSTGTRKIAKRSCILYICTIISELAWTFLTDFTDVDGGIVRWLFEVVVSFNILAFTIGIYLWVCFDMIKLGLHIIAEKWGMLICAIPLIVWIGLVATSPATGLVFGVVNGGAIRGRYYSLHNFFEIIYIIAGMLAAIYIIVKKNRSDDDYKTAKLVVISGLPFIITEIIEPFFGNTSLPTIAMFLSFTILYFARIGEVSSIDFLTGLYTKSVFKKKWERYNSDIKDGEHPCLYAFSIKVNDSVAAGVNAIETDCAYKALAGAIRSYLVTSDGCACSYKSDVILLYLCNSGYDPQRIMGTFDSWFDKMKDIREDISDATLYTGYTIVRRGFSCTDAIKAAVSYLDADKRERENYVPYCVPEKYSRGFNETISDLDKYNVTSMILHDSVTGLYNLDGFLQKLRKTIDISGEEYILVQYDIKNFGLFSSVYPERNIEGILIELADGMKCFGSLMSGLITCHLYDDRFLIALPSSQYTERNLAENMERIVRMYADEGYRLKLQAGICCINDSSIKLNTYIGHTSIALKTLNDNDDGKLYYYYDAEMMRRIINRETIIRQFPQAIQRGEFHAFLQPQVDANGRLLGAEALVRWINGPGSIISPADFIPVLEEKNVVYKLDQEIWRQTAEILSRWKNKKLTLSVNFSTKDIFYIDVPKFIEELQSKYDFGNRLKIEITESSMIVNMDCFIELVNTLHDRGIQVEIDDFGSGYSSLNMLKDIHADILKIDMNFLSVTDERSFTVLRNVIEMAHELNMTVICEGIERADEVEALRNMHCDMFQGYYYSKPVSLEEFEEKYSNEINRNTL